MSPGGDVEHQSPHVRLSLLPDQSGTTTTADENPGGVVASISPWNGSGFQIRGVAASNKCVAENGTAFVASRRNMLPAAGPFNAEGSGHERAATPIALVNC